MKEKFEQLYKTKAKQPVRRPSRHGVSAAFTNTPTLVAEFTSQDGDTVPGDGAFFHHSVLVPGHFTKTSNSVNNRPASRTVTKYAFTIDLDQGQRDNQETLNTSTAKYESHLDPKLCKSLLSEMRKTRTYFYQPVSIIFPQLWHASCSKCMFWHQQVEIDVSQDKLTHSTVADGSFTALDVNFHKLSYQKAVKYIYDFILP